MRTRLDPVQRRQKIVHVAQRLFHAQGYAATEMEDIRKSCDLSRGGLYHHFDGKAAILEAIVCDEVQALVDALEDSDSPPIETLLAAGSSHLGSNPGIVAALDTADARDLYLASLDKALARLLSPVLSARLVDRVRPGIDPDDVAELFLTMNTHINRRVFLGAWTEARAARFAATALKTLEPLIEDGNRLSLLAQDFQNRGTNP